VVKEETVSDLSRRLRVALATAAGIALVLLRLTAIDSAWVHQSDTPHIASNDAEVETAEFANGCEGIMGIPFGDDPGWVRVTRDPSPFAPITEMIGQVLDPHAFLPIGNGDGPNGIGMTNSFITYTDNTFTHYGRDFNVFLTLDVADRHFLADGNFEEYDEDQSLQEYASIEIEWERGALAPFAIPAIGDRLRVFGPLIFDCGHGDDGGEPQGLSYRTEIHPPAGWVIYRQTADADGVPQGDKRLQNPWVWYESTDLQGMSTTLPSTSLHDSPVQATVADAFFSSYGGNAMESLNGCDDNSDPIDADCLLSSRFHQDNGLDTFEWGNDILNQDYTFPVPAPPLPAGAPVDAELIYEIESRCGEVPPNPTFPNKGLLEFEDDPEGPYSDDREIGAVTCNPGNPIHVVMDRAGTAAWNDTGRPAIRVSIRANTGPDGIPGTVDDTVYPTNDYLAFAYRIKLAWNWIPPTVTSFRTANVHLDTLNVYQNGEDGTDGEWLMAVRVNEHWLYPVQGDIGEDDNDSDDTNEPFYEDGAIPYVDEGEGPDHYNMGPPGQDGLTYQVQLLPGENVRIWERTNETDEPDDDDVLPVINQAIPAAQLGGSYSMDVGSYTGRFGGHTITVNVSDATIPVPGPAAVGFFGNARLDPVTNLWRINGTDPMYLAASIGEAVQYRMWRVDGTPPPFIEAFTQTNAFGVFVLRPLAPQYDGLYNFEFATLFPRPDGKVMVSARVRMQFEIDNTPPVLSMPDDIEVDATETAGAYVEFVVSATDNFDPQPVLDNPVLPTVGCEPSSGALFPNGANAPKTTVVDCEAIDAVGNSTAGTFNVTVTSPFGYLKDFVAFGVEWADLATGTNIQTGNAGAFTTSGGVQGRVPFEVATGSSVIFGPDSQVAAESVYLGNRNVAGEVFIVDQIAVGNGTTLTQKTGYIPLFLGLPLVPAAGPGGPNQSINANLVLAPGNYGTLEVKPNVTLTLAAGNFSFSAIDLQPGSRLHAAGAATIVVAGKVRAANGTAVGPAPGSGIGARDVVLYAHGVDGPPSNPPHAITFGSRTTLALNAYAPNGTLSIGSQATAVGAFLGRRVTVGSNTVMTLDSSFLIPEP
jgi:hypothetical protein